MDTLQFFQAILPELTENEKAYFVVTLDPVTGAPRHIAYPTLETLAHAAITFDAQGDKTVYHACASYKQGSLTVPDSKKPGKTKKVWRVPENVGRMKSFWVDLDVGADKAAEGKGYATRKEAAEAIVKFCTDVGLNGPLMVKSGGGLHCYWPLTRSIGANAWRAMAAVFKQVLSDHGVLADPTRTADAASILRPPGTHNRKDPANPKLVEVLTPGAVMAPEDFRAVLEAKRGNVDSPSPAAGDGLDALGAAPAWVLSAPITNGLEAHKAEYPPTTTNSIEKVAEHCQQVRFVRDTKGEGTYDQWRGAIGMITFCREPRDLAEEWTSNRLAAGHGQADWDDKYDSWNTAPATCAFFNKANPGGCAGCTHAKDDGTFDITTPLQLGRVMPEVQQEMEVVVEQVVAPGVVVPVTYVIPEKPYGFQWDDGRETLYRSHEIKSKDGELEIVTSAVTDKHFYIVNWIRKEDGDVRVTVRCHLPRGAVDDFVVDSGSLSSPADSMKVLAKRGVFSTHNKDSGMHLHAYLKDSIAKIQSEVDELKTYTAYGWNDDSTEFLYRKTLYKTDGTQSPALLSGIAEDMYTANRLFPNPRGTLQGYVDAVNEVYARPGMEPLQYAFCNAFGSILTPFSGETLYNGLLFAITGGKTARGKTTVATAALYAFGDAQRMTYNKKSTINARYASMGGFGNLPLLFDEFTDIAPDELSAWAYSTSEGRDKARMSTGNNGLGLAKTSTWQLSPYVTANTDLHARLAELRGNTQAEAVRIIQIHIDRYKLPILQENQVTQALNRMANNMGHAGQVFIEHVVANLPAMLSDIAALSGIVTQAVPGVEYRFFRAHAVCTLAAAKVMIQLGLVDFDFNQLLNFAIAMTHDTIEEVNTTNVVDPEDMLSQMIAAMVPDVISTIGYSDSRSAAPEEVRLHRQPKGRYVAGAPNTQPMWANKLFLVRSAVKSWATEQRIGLDDVLEAARAKGALVDETMQVNLTKGVKAPKLVATCITLDMTKLDVAMPVALVHNSEELEDTGTGE